MRIQLIFALLSFSLSSFSVTDNEVKDLFSKYGFIMDGRKTELIEEVFSKRFINESGGKKELVSKIEGLPVSLTETSSKVYWKKSARSKFYLVRYKEVSSMKSSSSEPETDFILIKENGRLKIDGTVSDGH